MKKPNRDYDFPTVVTSKAGVRRVLAGNEYMIRDALSTLRTLGALVVTFRPPRGRSKVGTVEVKAAHRA
jgi:hypothetical protein